MRNRRRVRLNRELLKVHRALGVLDRSLLRLVPLLTAAVFTDADGETNGRARPRVSPKVAASLVLQGRYMGYVRQLSPRQKAQVRKIRDVKGVRAAIARARGLVGAQH